MEAWAYAVVSSRAVRMPLVSFTLCAAIARKSHSFCSPYQKSSDWPKKAPKRIDMAGVIERRPSTISLTARGGTRMARPMAFCEMPIGLRYSSKRISPGVIGGFKAVMYRVIAARFPSFQGLEPEPFDAFEFADVARDQAGTES